jgi:hypothetical protein
LDFLFPPRVKVSDNRKGVASTSLPLYSAGKDVEWPASSLVRLCFHEGTVDTHREMCGRFGTGVGQ